MEVSLLGRYVQKRREAHPDFDPPDVHQGLRHAGGAARVENPRHFRAARSARRQAAIPASHPAGMGLSAALAGASGAGARCTAGTACTCRSSAALKQNGRTTSPHAPWCLPQDWASACGRSPTRCRSRWSRSRASADRPSCSTGSPRRGSSAPWSTCIISPTRSNGTSQRRTAAADRDLRRARQAARHRRRRGQGAAPARPRAVLPRQLRHASGSTA